MSDCLQEIRTWINDWEFAEKEEKNVEDDDDDYNFNCSLK